MGIELEDLTKIIHTSKSGGGPLKGAATKSTHVLSSKDVNVRWLRES